MQRFRRQLYFVGRKLRWMVITVLAPEFVFGKAAVDFWTAYTVTKELKR